MANMPKYTQENNTFSKKRLKLITFFKLETDSDPDRKPTIKQKTGPDPVLLPKVNPSGL
jgi:hypothetical protein